MTDFTFKIRLTESGDTSRIVVFEPGIHVIYGESGVGKSALCRRLVSRGDFPNGQVFEVEELSRAGRPMLVTQDPDDQIVAPSVFRELAFNLENLGWNPPQIRQRVDDIVRLIPRLSDWNLDRHPSSLSGGERQMLNLGTALSVKPDLLVIDDGLAFLSKSNKRKMVDIFQDHCERTDAVIVWATSDSKDLAFGKTSWEFKSGSLMRVASSSSPSRFDGTLPPGKATLKLVGLTFGYNPEGYPVFKNQSLTLGPFRSLGVLGDNGSGKTTLGRLLSGIVPPGQGKIELTLQGSGKCRVGFLPQFPERLFGGRTLSELLDELVENGLFQVFETIRLEEILGELGIIWTGIRERPIHTLQVSHVRVVITLIICLANYDVMILDEPLFGLGRTQRDKLIGHLRAFLSHKHLVFITHSQSAAESVCDSAVTISAGAVQMLYSKGER